MTRLTDLQIAQLAARLSGTMRDLAEVLTTEFSTDRILVDETSIQMLEQLIFQCRQCDRWLDITDLAGADLCADCNQDVLEYCAAEPGLMATDETTHYDDLPPYHTGWEETEHQHG